MRILYLIAFLLHSIGYSQNQLDDSINKILDEEIKSLKAPGLSIGIVQNGKLICQKNRGMMNLEYNLPINDSTVFGLASITKQFTSACIGILEHMGKLTVNDDVRLYIPELENYPDTIRIKHLLNHTSGIRNHNVLLDLKGFDYEHQGYTNASIQALMFKQKGLNNRPGEKMLYSNTNYVLLALIVERVSGQKIQEFVKENIFDPLEMHHTLYKSDLEEIIVNKAHCYYKEDGKYLEPQSFNLCVGAGGMGSTVQDLAKWSNALLNPKHEFNYLKDFITSIDTLNNGVKMKHARGMFVSPYKGHYSFNHSGRSLGMRSQIIFIPEENLSVIVLTNSEHINAVNLSYQILDLFLTDQKEEKKANSYKHNNQELKNFEGVYQELNSDLRMTIYFENDTLKALSSFGQTGTPLVSQSANSLCRTDNPFVVYTFEDQMDSEVDLYVDFGGAMFYFEKIELNPTPNQKIVEYQGSYYSKELDVTYNIVIIDGELMLSFPNNANLNLKEGVKDTFGANRRTKYTFFRDENNQVIGFKVAAEGTVKGIVFNKSL